MAEEAINDIHRHVVNTPYAEFPRHVHKAKGEYKVVANKTEKAEALAAGWSLTPIADEPDVALVGDAPAKDAKPAKSAKKTTDPAG